MNKYRNVYFKQNGNFVEFYHEDSKRIEGRTVYRNGTLIRSLPYSTIDVSSFAVLVIDELYNRMYQHEIDELKSIVFRGSR